MNPRKAQFLLRFLCAISLFNSLLRKVEHLFEKSVDKRTDVLYNSIIEQMFIR